MDLILFLSKRLPQLLGLEDFQIALNQRSSLGILSLLITGVGFLQFPTNNITSTSSPSPYHVFPSDLNDNGTLSYPTSKQIIIR